MCLVALFFQSYDDAPVVVGANREEAYARGGLPPRLLAGAHRAVGGVDPTAGGTWLGVNERGVLIAITNRPKEAPPARPRSRGLLARDLLDCGSAAAAATRAAKELGQGRYAGCNVLCADARSATVLHDGGAVRGQPLAPGLHFLTANDLNDPGDARQEFARAWLRRRAPATSMACVAALSELCGLTGDAPMCLRRDEGGTVSSTIMALRWPLERATYLHSQGPPDVTPFVDYSPLFREMATSLTPGT